MSIDAPSPREIRFTAEFKRNLRQLAKKYRRIQSDLQPILDELTGGQLPGDQIPGVGAEVFKVRAKNSDSRKGKSGGYRLVYWVKSDEEVILVTVYSKTEQEDVAPELLRQAIDEYAASSDSSVDSGGGEEKSNGEAN